MKIRAIVVAATLAAVAVDVPAQTAEPHVDVRAAMVEGINPAALAIWEVGNNAMDDTGSLDPVLMDEAGWSRIHEAAQTLSDYGRRMARAEAIHASGPDLVGGEVPEGVASREEIQAMIDADPEGFRALSAEMAGKADEIARAAESRDLTALSDLVLTFDGACQACHERYWYPQQ